MPWDPRVGGGTASKSCVTIQSEVLNYVDSAVSAVAAAGGGSVPAPVLTPFVLDVATCLDGLLTAWSSDIDVDGLWGASTGMRAGGYWFTATAPAAAGAMYDRVISGWKWRTRAIATIEGALNRYTQSNGSLGPNAPPGDNTIDTMEFMKVLATCRMIYGANLTSVMRDRWDAALVAASAYLKTSGGLTYYTNGNINLGYFAVLRLAHKITGNYATGHYAEKAWWTAHDPAKSIHPSWAGWGYVFTSTPNPDTANPYDGAGSTAYFTEEGAGGVGLDWDYSQLSLAELAFLYQWDRDPRTARLINLIINTIWPRVNTTTWELQTAGGSRLGFGAGSRLISSTSAGLIVANLLLGRTGLGDHQSQFYTGNGGIKQLFGVVGPTSGAPGIYRGSMQDLGTFLNVAAGL